MDVFGAIPDWGQALIAVAAVLTAVSYLYQKWIKPLLKMARDTATNMDTLHTIAEQFRPNHGTSLRDTVDEIKQTVEATTATMEGRTALFDQIQTTMETTQTVLQAHLDDDQEAFARAQNALALGQQMLLERLEKIEATVDSLSQSTLKRSTD